MLSRAMVFEVSLFDLLFELCRCNLAVKSLVTLTDLRLGNLGH